MSRAEVTVEAIAGAALDAAWPDLARLFQGIAAYHEPLTREHLQPGWEGAWRQQIERPGVLILLVRDASGRAIGFVTAEERANPVLGLAYGMLDNAYVEERWRGRGIGRLLVERVEDWCRQRGLPRLDLTVRTVNVDGIAAWRAMGFVDESLRMTRAVE